MNKSDRRRTQKLKAEAGNMVKINLTKDKKNKVSNKGSNKVNKKDNRNKKLKVKKNRKQK